MSEATKLGELDPVTHLKAEISAEKVYDLRLGALSVINSIETGGQIEGYKALSPNPPGGYDAMVLLKTGKPYLEHSELQLMHLHDGTVKLRQRHTPLTETKNLYFRDFLCELTGSEAILSEKLGANGLSRPVSVEKLHIRDTFPWQAMLLDLSLRSIKKSERPASARTHLLIASLGSWSSHITH